MSESVSAPAEAPGDAPAPVSPAPNTQAAISISDAARMLRSARPAPQPVAAPEAPREPPRGDGAAQEPLAAPAEAPRRASGVEAMERALGIKPAEGDGEAAPEGDATAASGFEFEGRRLSEAELRRELNLAKDYTFKTQQLAQQQREVQDARNMLAQFLPTIAPEIQRMQQQFQQTQPPDPVLKQTNPQAYVEQMNAFYEAWAHNQRYEQMQRQMHEARDAAIGQAVADANKYLAEKYSFWSDPQQRGEVVQHLRRWATQEAGYSDAELDGLTNPRYLETLLKAMAYDSQMKGMPRTAAPTPVVRAAPPRGAAPPPRPVEQVAAASEAFAAKPSWQNGAALLTAQQTAARRSGNGHSNW